MVERSQKKAGFLSLLLNRLGIKASVYGGELHSLDHESKFRTITLRRVAFDRQLVSNIRAHLAPQGTVISFGPHLIPDISIQPQVISYTIDGLPPRQLFRATDF
jgi:16S rRNA G527 N7-methylase RsmG